MNTQSQIKIDGLLEKLPRSIKNIILIFLATILFGFIMGFEIVYETTKLSLTGIEENFLGNESDESAEEMIFKKSPREIRTMIHNHVLSLSSLFMLIAIILMTTSANRRIKYTIAIEPFISLFLTFGGIYFVWLGNAWFTPVIFISGVLMFISLSLSFYFIIKDCLK